MQTHLMIMADNYTNTNLPYETDFEVSDFLEFNDWIEEGPPLSFSSISADYNIPQNPNYASNEIMMNSGASGISSSSSSSIHEGNITRDSGSGREKKEIREKVAFKTKSEIEVLNDGFKWRKYGKKMVKNSPNPRNYYKCSIEGCSVKKRVERDKDDPTYVVTTYEGIHNHQGPPQL
ncbi:hypothetical protein ABFS82_05G137300 [Erythranthe guttata]|uniref:probable WRKY transcription factor 50 n=1 Tax=Erythranthe guttata TaxID=4155 RepID=UPI00064D9D22|nr:PREDICTED: probable WRKY transcription factor 50 [Erythranthe guttata]|eukprot:XP_012847225.1 PREDICTED: probable WRKY transcription factor 50 [Erythranthe guttata]